MGKGKRLGLILCFCYLSMGGWVPSLPTETALFASVGGEF